MAQAAPQSIRRRVERVTLPRYDVFYQSAEEALEDALRIKEERLLTLDLALGVAVGSDVVLDLRAAEVPLQATLLFRVLQEARDRTYLEFWARRQTDGALLQLWLESLRLDPDIGADSEPRAQLSQTETHRVLELCRRVLARNPFTALGVHWSARPHELQHASQRAEETLRMFLEHSEVPETIRTLAERALMRLPAVVQQLGTTEDRKLARAKFVTNPQLAIAREMAREKLEFARMRQDSDAIADAAAMIEELAPI